MAGLKSSFRILAAYEGRGKLNPVLSVEATAQADGTFELAGLTPGTYRVQAARDGIWLSQSTVLVAQSGSLPAVTLDIAPAGSPITVRLVDGAGQPLAGRTVSLQRPSGPLTDALRPRSLITDASGELRLEGLEAGVHQLQIMPAEAEASPSTAQTVSVTVPPVADGGSAGAQTIVAR